MAASVCALYSRVRFVEVLRLVGCLTVFVLGEGVNFVNASEDNEPLENENRILRLLQVSTMLCCVVVCVFPPVEFVLFACGGGAHSEQVLPLVLFTCSVNLSPGYLALVLPCPLQKYPFVCRHIGYG